MLKEQKENSIKIKKGEQVEKLLDEELALEVVEAKNFFIQKMEFLDLRKLQSSSPKEVFDLYREYINGEASREHYQKLISAGGENMSAFEEDNYRYYLLGKLPYELQERNKNKPVNELEEIHKAREEMRSKMILGFRVSSAELRSGETIETDRTQSREINEMLLEGNLGEYSDNEKYLYGSASKKRNLYLIEGNESDQITDPNGWRARAIGKGKGLRVIGKLTLTPELEKALGLKFRQTQ
ncbi:MAG: hypothetical protein HYW78_03800 [Parcubacteria group bacterium]|nr:hypothetical protein [Parcubacteria group bacterium]